MSNDYAEKNLNRRNLWQEMYFKTENQNNYVKNDLTKENLLIKKNKYENNKIEHE